MCGWKLSVLFRSKQKPVHLMDCMSRAHMDLAPACRPKSQSLEKNSLRHWELDVRNVAQREKIYMILRTEVVEVVNSTV
jgi:hypothetical protein